jgi:hypothetical protein
MRICDFKQHLFRSESGNRFIFIFPFINICFYDEYLTVSFGWLFYWAYFYVDLREKIKPKEDTPIPF